MFTLNIKQNLTNKDLVMQSYSYQFVEATNAQNLPNWKILYIYVQIVKLGQINSSIDWKNCQQSKQNILTVLYSVFNYMLSCVTYMSIDLHDLYEKILNRKLLYI